MLRQAAGQRVDTPDIGKEIKAMKQIYNPYMPSFEYVPDGEPHVFGDRIYLYGSHDRFGGVHFCLNDYVCYSAPVSDLTDWRYEGVIYRKDQDPRNQNIPADAPPNRPASGLEAEGEDSLNPPGVHAMWAPDVVKGHDGRFYLYYCLDFLNGIGVAVCDTPAGKYEFLGFVRHEDGTVLGEREGDLMQFDPGVFLDEDGSVYLYSGNGPRHPEHRGDGHGSQVMTLCEDMLTLRTEPRHLLPNLHESVGTDFEGHAFFEASSIRRIRGKYYFVYSSVQSHELCYAVSDRPDGGYVYGGTLVDIGDVFLEGRKEQDAVNCLGNTHGGIECCEGQWYVFYHRQTNRTNFARQGCAEKIYFDAEGRIAQAEVTSCGLNKGPLEGRGTYPAAICCHLTKRGKAVFSHPRDMGMEYPYLTQDMRDAEPTPELLERDKVLPVQYVRNLLDGALIGYKYFAFQGMRGLRIKCRGKADGKFAVMTGTEGPVWGEIPVVLDTAAWTELEAGVRIPDGVSALYLQYFGEGAPDMITFTILAGEQTHPAA